MNADTAIGIVNFVSRWILFFAVSYKAYQTREKGWALLSAAFFINALDVESYIFGPLGIHINPGAYPVASQIPNFLVAVLLIWGALHLEYETTQLRHVIYVSLFVVASYLWLFLVAADVFGDNFILKYSFPAFAYGGMLIYFGIVLRKKEVPYWSVDALFPWGLILLGALNLTYPVGRNVHWYAKIAFLLGAAFRVISAVGAFKFVFVPFLPAKVEVPPHEIPSGAFLFYTNEKVSEKMGKVEALPNLIRITREDVDSIKEKMNQSALVFWATRVVEGEISKNPEIYAISPTKIDILTDLIAKAVERGYRVIYIDAVEYLILENGFERTFKFLLNVKDRILLKGGTMILVVDPEALDTNQRRILEREFERG